MFSSATDLHGRIFIDFFTIGLLEIIFWAFLLFSPVCQIRIGFSMDPDLDS
jgi:hypothetical protein